MPHQMSVILTTVGSQEDATQMSEMLIARKFAACVQELNVTSHFRWDGAVQKEPEILLLIKTAASRVDAVIEAIREQHKYDLPEIIALPVAEGLAAYIDWVVTESRDK
ncbi:MAG: divalent-cation tolerance protein CutA [Gammaproteobacteria bacterium]|nr:divalent-cation tolerance protein CutA [Gammaproteobacteria bacterium]